MHSVAFHTLYLRVFVSLVKTDTKLIMRLPVYLHVWHAVYSRARDSHSTLGQPASIRTQENQVSRVAQGLVC